MSGAKYFSTTLEKQKVTTQDRLNQFLSDPKAKILFMNEPVGYGKTTTLMDLCLTPKEDGQFRRSVFLTYSNRKAAELEGEFLERINAPKLEPRLLRVFGEAQITDETRYRQENDVTSCHYSYERKKMLEKGKGPILVCMDKCEYSQACPYFRTVTKARENVFDILIGNLNEMQTPNFYLDTKFKLPRVDLFILDEDAVRKAKFEFSLPAEQMVAFVDFLPLVPNLMDKDEMFVDLSLDQRKVMMERFHWLYQFFKEESGFYAPDEKLDKEKLKSRGFDDKRISADKSRSWFKSINEKAQKDRINTWYRHIRDALISECRTEIQRDSKTGRAVIWLFPNLKDFKRVFHEIGFASNPNAKIIITDATSELVEIIARFQIASEDEIHLSYHPLKDGYIVPKGKLYQVVDNVSKTKLFGGADRKLNISEIKNLLSATRILCDGLEFSPTDTWIIPFQDLARNNQFREMSESFGFKVNPELYHGAVRGLNELKDKDIVILGSNFPRDEDMRKQQIIDLSMEVPYSYCDDFLKWAVDTEGRHIGLEVLSPRQLGIRDWMTFVERDHGKIGRKIYLENVIQSMRSRFFWNSTKTLIFSAYPMADYGIAVHGLMSRDDFRNHYLKKIS